ncbi:DUF3846 domain-containing protein [Brevibacillus fulvus]|uniref:DUF3846 domain-containing protein n=1 Tax=Brevibacillus fulvus TaxID=1125967 RepID=A0A938XWH8_9BACL|nr:DUF3846 domain-containing protein [Brevibacillus fulvus]MBM7589196.1 hypothetical protein [Brevibacillus fulvus]
MKVFVAVPGEAVKVQEMAPEHSVLQEKLGGSLECIQLGNQLTLYCNQDGNEEDLPVNPHFARGIIKGPLIIAKTSHDGKMTDLTEQDIHYIQSQFIRL